jgi:uncharacterized protein YqeY
MSLTEKINADIKTAMLAKEREKLEALRAIKAALLLEATKDGSGVITEDAELKILQKLYKQRVDAGTIYNDQNRKDLAVVEEFQADIIKAYLPSQLSEAEIAVVIKGVIEKMGAKGPQDMGKVMGSSMGQLQGKADGNLISKVVKDLLSSL